MNTATITVQSDLKEKAQRVAIEKGISLDSIINSILKYIVRTKTVPLDDEEPSEYLNKILRQAERDLKEGKTSPTFDNAEDAIAWLHRGK